MKKWYFSRTIWLGIFQGISGVLVALLTENPTWQGIGWLAILKSLVDISLRFITESKIE